MLLRDLKFGAVLRSGMYLGFLAGSRLLEETFANHFYPFLVALSGIYGIRLRLQGPDRTPISDWTYST